MHPIDFSKKMLLTVVIPVYNRANIVPRTLKSIERQSVRDFSVILVDNNSTDGTLSVLEKWRDNEARAIGINVRVISELKPGSTAARNAGLRLVETPYTMFFDSDDEMLPNHIADFIEAIKANPSVDLLGRPALSIYPDGRKRIMRFTTSSMLFNHIFHSILGTLRYVAKTELFRRVGGWNESLPAWNDLEFGVRLLLANPRAVKVNGEPSVLLYVHNESITGTDFFHNSCAHQKSLNKMEEHLRTAGNNTAITWINTRRVILAARHVIEGHPTEGKDLLQRTITASSAPFRLRLLYMQHRLMGRGTAIFAKLLFR